MQTLLGLLELFEGLLSTRFIASALGGNRLLLGPQNGSRLLEPSARLIALTLSHFAIVLCSFELLLQGGDFRFVGRGLFRSDFQSGFRGSGAFEDCWRGTGPRENGTPDPPEQHSRHHSGRQFGPLGQSLFDSLQRLEGTRRRAADALHKRPQ
jgi:hypothetical protein